MEFQQLISEIDDISVQTTFNDMNLLDGTLGGGAAKAVDVAATVAGNAITGADVAATAAEWTTGDVTYTADGVFKMTIAYTDAAGIAKTKQITANADTDVATTQQAIIDAINADTDLKDLFVAADDGGDGITITAKAEGAGQGAVTGITVDDNTNADIANVGSETTAGADATKSYDLSGVFANGDSVVIDGKTFTFDAAATADDADKFTDLDDLKAKAEAAITGLTVDVTTDTAVTFAMEGAAGGLQIQVGAKQGETMNVSISAMDSTSLKVKALSIATQDGAGAAITAVRDAINTVSTQRATLGAAQNRLEHKIANLDTSAENLSAAESRIRDVDLASEMTSFTKNNILSQAATAMLAQANTIPQNVLQLLR